MKLDLAEVLLELQDESGWLADGESDYVPHYWNLHGDEDPKALRSPDAYEGGPDLAIHCTQLEVPASQQRKLVAQWVQALPTMQRVRRLWFTSRMPQELFDAACCIEGLEDLWIHSSGIASLQAVSRLSRLKRFRLGQSASVSTLTPLAGMTGLEWLFLNGVAKVPSLEPLATLSGLEGLFLAGNESKPLVAQSLAPLAVLRGLRWLHLGALRVAAAEPEPLAPLEALVDLAYLGLPNFFSTEQFARLAACLPRTRGAWLAPYTRQHRGNFTCRKCRQRATVFTAGRPARSLCPACDNEALAEHVLRYRTAQLKAAPGATPA